MTSGEYLKQLEKYLRKLPQSDYEDAMEYFTEYFADAGPENEQAVIKELEKNDRRQRRLDRDSRPVCSPDRSPDSDQHSHRSALRGPLCGTA